MAERSGSSTASAIAQNGVFEWAARAGFVASGLVHLSIGYLAAQLALGDHVAEADHTGAFAQIAREPAGRAGLWVVAAAFLAMSGWRVVETFLGRAYDPTSGRALTPFNRLQAFSLAVIYCGFAYSAYGFAAGRGTSSGEQAAGISARLMQSGLGAFALVVAGVVLIIVGGYHVYKGASRQFLDDLIGRTSAAVQHLGMVGYIAKGIVIAGVGGFVIIAVHRSDPSQASGLDAALRELGLQPYGAALVLVAGAGLVVYGVYSFAMARSAKM